MIKEYKIWKRYPSEWKGNFFKAWKELKKNGVGQLEAQNKRYFNLGLM